MGSECEDQMLNMMSCSLNSVFVSLYDRSTHNYDQRSRCVFVQPWPRPPCLLAHRLHHPYSQSTKSHICSITSLWNTCAEQFIIWILSVHAPTWWMHRKYANIHTYSDYLLYIHIIYTWLYKQSNSKHYQLISNPSVNRLFELLQHQRSNSLSLSLPPAWSVWMGLMKMWKLKLILWLKAPSLWVSGCLFVLPVTISYAHLKKHSRRSCSWFRVSKFILHGVHTCPLLKQK